MCAERSLNVQPVALALRNHRQAELNIEQLVKQRTQRMHRQDHMRVKQAKRLQVSFAVWVCGSGSGSGLGLWVCGSGSGSGSVGPGLWVCVWAWVCICGSGAGAGSVGLLFIITTRIIIIIIIIIDLTVRHAQTFTGLGLMIARNAVDKSEVNKGGLAVSTPGLSPKFKVEALAQPQKEINYVAVPINPKHAVRPAPSECSQILLLQDMCLSTSKPFNPKL
jgi:hypothetical protein